MASVKDHSSVSIAHYVPGIPKSSTRPTQSVDFEGRSNESEEIKYGVTTAQGKLRIVSPEFKVASKTSP